MLEEFDAFTRKEVEESHEKENRKKEAAAQTKKQNRSTVVLIWLCDKVCIFVLARNRLSCVRQTFLQWEQYKTLCVIPRK